MSSFILPAIQTSFRSLHEEFAFWVIIFSWYFHRKFALYWKYFSFSFAFVTFLKDELFRVNMLHYFYYFHFWNKTTWFENVFLCFQSVTGPKTRVSVFRQNTLHTCFVKTQTFKIKTPVFCQNTYTCFQSVTRRCFLTCLDSKHPHLQCTPIVGVCNVICFVVVYFMSILVLQSSWWGRESWLLCLICLPGVSWWLSGSPSRCRGVVCGLWLWYFLIILTYYFWYTNIRKYFFLWDSPLIRNSVREA